MMNEQTFKPTTMPLTQIICPVCFAKTANVVEDSNGNVTAPCGGLSSLSNLADGC